MVSASSQGELSIVEPPIIADKPRNKTEFTLRWTMQSRRGFAMHRTTRQRGLPERGRHAAIERPP
jgi:hypothetical protein